MRKIKNRVIVLMLASLVPILVILTLLNYKVRSQNYTIAEKNISHAIHEIKFFQLSLTTKTREILSLLSQEDEVQQIDTASMSKLFSSILLSNGEIYSNLFFCDLNGNVIASGKQMHDATNSSTRKYFTDAIKTGKFSTGEYIVGRITNNPVFHFSYPVKNHSNKTLGVLVISINLNKLDAIFSKTYLPEGSFMRIFDHNGISLLRLPPDPKHYQTGSKLREDFWKKISSSDSENSFIDLGSDNIEKFYSFINITTNESNTPFMHFLFGIPTSSIYTEANKYLHLSLAITIAATLLTVLIFRHYSQKTITKRIEILHDLTQNPAIANKNYTGDIYQDELTQLMLSFHDMIKRISKSSSQLIKAKEDAEAANLAKSRFLATMSHEIRTPFNGIMSMLQLCEGTNLTTEQKLYTSLALESTRKLLALVNEILDLARLEQGKEISCVTEFSLACMLADMEILFKSILKDKKIKYESHIVNDLPLLIGDELKVRQILFNLIGNALKATSDGSVVVSASPIQICQEFRKITIMFTITDTGLGIPQEQIKRLFKPFTQIKGTYTQSKSGTGLGLSIVTRLVKTMEGTLCISSEENAGTTVDLTLPFYYSEQRDTLLPQKNELIDLQTFKPTDTIKILLAEDERVNQIALQHLAKKIGLFIDVANNGIAALELLSQNNYDLVLMDIQMPELDGIQTTQRIRASKTTYANIPIIALTAYAMPGDKEMFIESGMNDYLSKPIEFNNLIQILQKYGRYHAEPQNV